MIDTLAKAAEAMGGCFDGTDRSFIRPITDSRQIEPGDLFFAMRGEEMDGHRFVAKALEAGAAAVVVDHDVSDVMPQANGHQLIVNDTRLALGLLGGFVRRSWSGPLVAVTGNSGKTTVKELIKSILEVAAKDPSRVLATQGNLNSYVGVPQTLCRLRKHHRYGVVELGASHVGELAWTSPLVQPQVAVITNVTAAHVGEFGSLANIAQAKSELLLGLASDGVAVLNRDDPFFPVWHRIALLNCDQSRIIDFGMNSDAHISASRLSHDEYGRYSFSLMMGGSVAGLLKLQLLGEHNVLNALAAAAAAHALGIDPPAIIQGLEQVQFVSGRMGLRQGAEGRLLLDDTYNANPGAIRAALDTLSLQPAPRWCLLGAMAELGAESDKWHAEIGDYAKQLGIDGLIAFGSAARPAAEAFGGLCFDDWEEFIAEVDATLPAHSSVLVKGSRSMRMERVVEHLSDENAEQ